METSGPEQQQQRRSYQHQQQLPSLPFSNLIALLPAALDCRTAPASSTSHTGQITPHRCFHWRWLLGPVVLTAQAPPLSATWCSSP